jgi:hypothetical protein
LLVVAQNGEGEGTHVGHFTWTSTTITPNSCTSPFLDAYVDDVVLTAANGDQLFGTATITTTGVADPLRVVGEGPLTITGGTGRFAQSTGAMRWSVVANLYEAMPLPDGTVLVPAFYTLEGTISSVGADKK